MGAFLSFLGCSSFVSHHTAVGKHQQRKGRNMSTSLINHHNTAIVGYSIELLSANLTSRGTSSVPPEFKGGRCWAQPYRRVKIVFDRFRLEPEVRGVCKHTMALNAISVQSHDLQSMACIHRWIRKSSNIERILSWSNILVMDKNARFSSIDF